MMTTVLTIIGSIGGFIILFHGIKGLTNIIRSVYAGRKARNFKYYYTFVELSCKWLCQDQKFHGFRKFELVSRIEDLNGLRVGMGPKSIGKFKITNGTLRKVDTLPKNTEWTDYICEITPSLHKREKKTIHFEYEAETYKEKSFPKYWMFVSENRCDKLLLRVVFDKIPDNDIKFIIENQIGDIISIEKLAVDIVSNECKKEICYIHPGLIYKIDWSNES